MRDAETQKDAVIGMQKRTHMGRESDTKERHRGIQTERSKDIPETERLAGSRAADRDTDSDRQT